MPEGESKSGMEAAQAASISQHITPENLSRPAGSSARARPTTRTAYLPQLDGLRALAIIMVFLHHAYNVPLLWSGVDLFFILSGFLITNILLRDSGRMRFGQMLGHFYLRRAQRILPAYIVCLALIAALTQQDWHRLWPFYAFFLQNVPYAFRMLQWSPLIPLWSLAVEQHFYLVWPFLVFFLPRRWLAPSMLTILLGVPILRTLCTPLFPFSEAIYVLTPFRIDTMAAGALAALVLPSCDSAKAQRWAVLAIAVGIAAYALLSPHPWFRRDANSAAFNSIAYTLNILILGGLFVCVTLAQPGSWLVRIFAFRPMRELGKISYAFYLLHLLVVMLVSRFLPYRIVAPAVFLITSALAALSWKFIEKPILSLGGGHRGAALKATASQG